MAKIYLAGPMTGYPKFNFPAFDYYRDYLLADGWEVFSPADNDRELLGKEVDWMPEAGDSRGPWREWSIPGAPSLNKMIGDDLRWIAQDADAIAMMPGWERSSGAKIEHALAVLLGHKVVYLSERINYGN